MGIMGPSYYPHVTGQQAQRNVQISERVTKGVRVRVTARYSPERSSPARKFWFFLYTIEIINEGAETVQLISRHSTITDADNHVEEVRGRGVVGRQPTLAPDELFEYTSGCPLKTPFGSMHGTYQMITASGEKFDADVAPFALTEPYTVH